MKRVFLIPIGDDLSSWNDIFIFFFVTKSNLLSPSTSEMWETYGWRLCLAIWTPWYYCSSINRRTSQRALFYMGSRTFFHGKKYCGGLTSHWWHWWPEVLLYNLCVIIVIIIIIIIIILYHVHVHHHDHEWFLHTGKLQISFFVALARRWKFQALLQSPVLRLGQLRWLDGEVFFFMTRFCRFLRASRECLVVAWDDWDGIRGESFQSFRWVLMCFWYFSPCWFQGRLLAKLFG